MKTHEDTLAKMAQAAKDCEQALAKYHAKIHGRKLMFRPSTIAVLLDLKLGTIHEWMRDGKFPSIQIGKTRWTTRKQLDQWLAHVTTKYGHGFHLDVDTGPQGPGDFDPLDGQ